MIYNQKKEIMKARILLFIAILLSGYSISISKELKAIAGPDQQGAVNVYTSSGLYPLTAKWVSEYSRQNPQLNIRLITSEDTEITGMLQSGSGIGFISDASLTVLNNPSTWNIVVGRDVIVPVMNPANPLREVICKSGITAAGLARTIESSANQTWAMLLGTTQQDADVPLHIYVMNDQTLISGLAGFLNSKNIKVNGTMVAGEKEMVAAIQKDPNALGFCRLPQIMNTNSQSLAESIMLVPIDKNGNGKIDYMEAIYGNVQEFSRGVWIGKYPDALSGTIYSVSSSKPKNKAELAFLNWVLTDGQQLLSANGYSDLVLNERQTQLEKINEPLIYSKAPESSYTLLMIVIFIVFGLIIAGYFLDVLIARKRTRRVVQSASKPALHTIIDEQTIITPKGLYFDKTHTWAYMKKNGTVKIGIDDFLQHVTGPLTRIELKQVGEKIKKGEHLLTIIQKGKQLNIYSPITGTITSTNKSLLSNATLLNSAPFTDGFIYTVEPTNWLLELQFMNMAEKYTIWLKSEYLRLRDFFATAVRIHAPAFAIVLQDGGVLRDGILAELGPEVWEDFQITFMDVNKQGM